jgi:hypothetical protein
LTEKSCLVVSVPKITGRYYTVQFLNGWGETVANINERVFPEHPNGEFAICLEGSQVPVPAGSSIRTIPRTSKPCMRFKTAREPTNQVPARSSSSTGIP